MRVLGKWETDGVEVRDPGLVKYITLGGSTHTHGKHRKQFAKSRISIVERMINTIMRSGSGKKIEGHLIDGRGGCGKKMQARKTIMEAFDLIHKKTGENPMQVLIKAIENAAPREETTRVRMGGMSKHIAVDISPQRRVNLALSTIGVAALGKTYKTKKSRAQVLADELVAAANNDNASMAVSKKIEIERIAKGAR
ncbi:MAG: 30S ribosomal protein S7 [Candidatus Diapherotrites archaeon]|nr:30S ribosomal protein S7 [Candidatus Diapherotrites archaeon]